MPKKPLNPPSPEESMMKEAKADFQVLLKMAEHVLVNIQKLRREQELKSRALLDLLDIRSRIFSLMLFAIGCTLLLSVATLLTVIYA